MADLVDRSLVNPKTPSGSNAIKAALFMRNLFVGNQGDAQNDSCCCDTELDRYGDRGPWKITQKVW